MAGRPPKASIDYAGWAVDIFDNDPKIDKLLDSQSWSGFGIYFYLCQRAYGSNGYFYEWSLSDAPTTARKMGGGIGSKTVENTVSLCLQIGLFDKSMFDRHGIITSRGIQKRFRQVALSRTCKVVIKDYWLLTLEESEGLVFHTLNSDYKPSKSNYDRPKSNYEPSKSNYDPLKESKVNETILNTTTNILPLNPENKTAVAVTEQQLIKHFLNNIQPTASKFIIDKLCSWLTTFTPEVIMKAIDESVESNHRSLKYIEGILNNWEKQQLFTLSLVEGHLKAWKDKPNTNSIKVTQRKKNSFNNFESRSTDYSEIERKERELLQNKHTGDSVVDTRLAEIMRRSAEGE